MFQSGCAPIDLAASDKRLAVVKYLISSVPVIRQKAFMVAVLIGDLKEVKSLIDKGINVNGKDEVLYILSCVCDVYVIARMS